MINLYNQKEMKRKQVFANKLLKVLVVGGVVTIAAVNPFFGLLAAKVIDGSYLVRATSVGKKQAKKYDLDDIFIKIPKKWDKQWRLIMFDIPVGKQKGRLALLSKLRQLGFIMLQKSIWAHPFECQNGVAVLARAFEVDKYVHQLTCDNISAGEYLKNEFEKRNNTKLN